MYQSRRVGNEAKKRKSPAKLKAGDLASLYIAVDCNARRSQCLWVQSPGMDQYLIMKILPLPGCKWLDLHILDDYVK